MNLPRDAPPWRGTLSVPVFENDAFSETEISANFYVSDVFILRLRRNFFSSQTLKIYSLKILKDALKYRIIDTKTYFINYNQFINNNVSIFYQKYFLFSVQKRLWCFRRINFTSQTKQYSVSDRQILRLRRETETRVYFRLRR